MVEPRTDPLALPVFWARAVVAVASRTYAVVYWWSLDDLVARTLRTPTSASARRSAVALSPGGLVEWQRLTHSTRAERIADKSTWRLPLDEACHSIYDLTTDNDEMVNLMMTNELAGTELLGLILAATRRVLDAHGILDRDVAIRFPAELHCMSLDYLTTDAVRVRRGMAVDRRSTRSVHVQTDSTVYFARVAQDASVVHEEIPLPLPQEKPRRPTSTTVLQLEKGRNMMHR